ncbi:hypothetical protein, partial [Phyllobacterium calauticae]|uniref:hypothetical protein n=1 Tax=Phyllobacterium calauticae TaxID=2817027 RepID=UPI001CBA9A0D
MATYKTETGLELDEADPDDAKILMRQRDAARAAGKSGADRAGTTKGRADLERAFDEGAASAAAPDAPTEGASGASRPSSGGGKSS